MLPQMRVRIQHRLNMRWEKYKQHMEVPTIHPSLLVPPLTSLSEILPSPQENRRALMAAMNMILNNPRILVSILSAAEMPQQQGAALRRMLSTDGVDITYELSVIPYQGGFDNTTHAYGSISSTISGAAYGSGSDYMSALTSSSYNSSLTGTNFTG